MCPSSGETTVFMHSRPKHAEKNKHTKKNCATSWLYIQDQPNKMASSKWA
jgi:hypothetical protein